MNSTVMGCMWYLDNDASFHMTGTIYLFSDLEEKDLQHNIEFGNDGMYSATHIGRITFQREYVFPLRLTDVFYVPCLRKNLVSIAVLEDNGYDVMFRKGKI